MKDRIVTYEGKPALIMGYTKNEQATILRFAGRMVKVVLTRDVKPYKGEKDAVALGLKDPPRKNR
jgi:hypothetical protein